jgi:serine/threonine protein kinase
VDAIIEGKFIFEGNNWEEISPNAVDLVRKLLDLDPENRIQAVKGLNDKWLLLITKSKKNNQRKILNQSVIQHLKKFIVRSVN